MPHVVDNAVVDQREATDFLKEVVGSIKTREAVEVGTKAVDYFRGQDFLKWVTANLTEILERHRNLVKGSLAEKKLAEEEEKDASEEGSGEVNEPKEKDEKDGAKTLGVDGATSEDADEVASAIGQHLLRAGLLARVHHAPLPNVDQSKIPVHLRDNQNWPRRVKIARGEVSFSCAPGGFYAINYDASSIYSTVLLWGTIAVVLIFCMFPIWPFAAKITTWYLGVVMATILLFCIVLRLQLFVLIWFCGRDFWFLPNLFDEDAGVIESFLPLYSYSKRDDDWLMVAVRGFAALLTAGSLFKLSETHSLTDISDAGVGAFLDILEWGHTKLSSNSTALSSNESLNALLSPSERKARHWDMCVQHCEFQDTDEFNEICFSDCQCLATLWASKCWRACEFEIRDELKERIKLCKDNNGTIPGATPNAHDGGPYRATNDDEEERVEEEEDLVDIGSARVTPPSEEL